MKVLLLSMPDSFEHTPADANTFDRRSDSRGAEPEPLDVGIVGARHYAFIGFERIGGAGTVRNNSVAEHFSGCQPEHARRSAYRSCWPSTLIKGVKNRDSLADAYNMEIDQKVKERKEQNPRRKS